MKKHHYLLVFTILAMLFVFEKPVFAANLKTLYTHESIPAKQRTVSGTTFEYQYYSYNNRSVLYAIRNTETKTVTTKFEASNILSDGITVYYCEKVGSCHYLYKCNLNSMERTCVKMLSSDAWNIDLCGYYKNKVFFIKNVPAGTFASINLKTKKITWIKDIVTEAELQGKYFTLTDGTGAGHSYISIYNASSGKDKTITNKPYVWHSGKKYVWYLEVVSGNWYTHNCKVNLIRWTNSSGKKKVLAKSVKIDNVKSFSDKYLKYYDWNGKLKKIKLK